MKRLYAVFKFQQFHLLIICTEDLLGYSSVCNTACQSHNELHLRSASRSGECTTYT